MSETVHTQNREVKESSGNNEAIKHLLLSFKALAEQSIENAQISHDLLDDGIDTELTVDFKKLIANPISHLLDTKNEVDVTVNNILSKIVAKYLSEKKDIVSHAFKTDVRNNRELHFSIVLKEDTFEARGELFKFLTEYKAFPNWEAHPINFQIIPESLIDKISILEKIV